MRSALLVRALATVGVLGVGGGFAALWLGGFSGDGWRLSMAVGGLAWIAYALAERRRWRTADVHRGVTAQIGALLGLFAACFVALTVHTLVKSYDRTWVWTASDRYVLSGRDVSVLAALQQPVHIRAFFPAGSVSAEELASWAGMLSSHTDRLSWSFHDPAQEPQLAAEFGVRGSHGTLHLASDVATKRVEWPVTLDGLVAALVVVQGTSDHQLCWLAGHGESDPDDAIDPSAHGLFAEELDRWNYDVVPVSTRNPAAFGDCDVLALVRPRVVLQSDEGQWLKQRLLDGLPLLILLEPGEAEPLGGALVDLGLRFDEHTVHIDNRSTVLGIDDPAMLWISRADLGNHHVVRDLQSPIVFPLARALHTTSTGAARWAPLLTQDGGVVLAAAGEISHPDGLARAVVFGDSDFASNRFIGWGANRDVVGNAVAWLVGESAQVGVRNGDPEILTIGSQSAGAVAFVTLVFLPGAVAIAGWWTLRRRRGR